MPRKPKPRTSQPDADDKGYFRLGGVLQHIPVSERTWWRGIAAGRYPKPVKLSPNVDGWQKRVIYRLCEELAAREEA